jgi:hypothetical protein
MALDYLTIPGMLILLSSDALSRILIIFPSATSVDVECTFSKGHLILSHVHIQLAIQSTHALLCLGVWSLMGYVEDSDVKAAAVLPEVIGDEEELPNDWDAM